MSGASRSPPTELILDSNKWFVKAAARFAAYEFIRNIRKVHQEKVRILEEKHLQCFIKLNGIMSSKLIEYLGISPLPCPSSEERI